MFAGAADAEAAGTGARAAATGAIGRSRSARFGEQSGSVEHLLLLVNSADSQLQFSLPAAPAGGPWIRLFDTALAGVGATSLGTAQTYAMTAHSAALLEC